MRIADKSKQTLWRVVVRAVSRIQYEGSGHSHDGHPFPWWQALLAIGFFGIFLLGLELIGQILFYLISKIG